jgi:hypothetical protein
LSPEAEAEVCRRYVEDGESLGALGRAYGLDYETIRRALKRNNVAIRPSGAYLRCNPERALPDNVSDTRYAPAVGYGGPDAALRRMIANRLHLVDLKRAKYSPRMTELAIERDGAPVRLAGPVSPLSLTGSSAAMCAGD